MTLAETTQKPDFTTLEWPSQNSMKMKISQFVSLDPYSTAPYKYTSKPAKLDCRPSSFLSTLFSSFFFLAFLDLSLTTLLRATHFNHPFRFHTKGAFGSHFQLPSGEVLASWRRRVRTGGCVFFLKHWILDSDGVLIPYLSCNRGHGAPHQCPLLPIP